MTTVPDYAALFEASPYPYLLIAPDKTLIGANAAYLTATETTADKIVGKHIFDAFPADPADPDSTNLGEVLRSIETALATRQPHTSPLLRYAVPREDGSGFTERLWSAVHTPVLDSAGQVLFVAQTAIDVTDLYRFDPATRRYRLKQTLDAVPDIAERTRVQLHEALTRILNAERTELQNLFDRAPGFIAILHGDAHVFDMANASFQRLVGARTLLGRPLLDALPELAGQDFAEALAQAVRTASPLALRALKLVLRRRQDGASEERYVDLAIQPIMGADDRMASVFLQGQDVTDAYLSKLALEEKIAQLEAARARHTMLLKLGDRLRGLADEPEAMMAAGSEELAVFLGVPRVGYVAFAEHSSQALVMNTYSDPSRVPPLPAVVEQPDEYGIAVMSDLRAGRAIVVNDLATDPRTAGAVAQSHAAIGARASLAVPIRRHERAVAFMFAHDDRPRLWQDEDISLMHQVADRTWEAVERARALLALRDTDRRKDEFLAMLAHELRNPLAPIGAAARLLQMANLDRERLRQTSEVIGRQVRHMTGLIDDLLDVSRVTSGLISLERAPLDVREAITDAVEQVNPLIRARGHDLALHLAPERSLVSGDRKRLVQVLGNILNNAAKYTADGGSIVLRTQVTVDHVVVEIGDNGIGMPPELVRRAFDLFAQAERSPDRSSGGLGLGLALVKSLVELHGGTVSCFSEGVGKGSLFRICLPRLEYAAQPVSEPADTDAGAASAALRILVVDDNVDAAAMLAMLLEAMGHRVLTAHTPAHALALAPGFAPQVCLLDIGLPEMNGYELVQRLRQLPETRSARMVAVTGYGQQDDRQRSAEAGFDHHLVKPVDTDKLAAILAGRA